MPKYFSKRKKNWFPSQKRYLVVEVTLDLKFRAKARRHDVRVLDPFPTKPLFPFRAAAIRYSTNFAAKSNLQSAPNERSPTNVQRLCQSEKPNPPLQIPPTPLVNNTKFSSPSPPTRFIDSTKQRSRGPLGMRSGCAAHRACFMPSRG